MTSRTIATYDVIAEKYAKKHWRTRLLVKERAKFSRLCKKGEILDAGCGVGIYTKFFLSRGLKTTGIDLSSGMLEEAKKRVPKGKFIKMSITKLEFGHNVFEGVWCAAVLLHLKPSSTRKALAEINNVIKPDGLLFVSVKKGSGAIIKTYPDGTKRFFQFYGTSEISELIRKSGFRIEELHENTDEDEDSWVCIFARKHK